MVRIYNFSIMFHLVFLNKILVHLPLSWLLTPYYTQLWEYYAKFFDKCTNRRKIDFYMKKKWGKKNNNVRLSGGFLWNTHLRTLNYRVCAGTEIFRTVRLTSVKRASLFDGFIGYFNHFCATERYNNYRL